MQQAFSHLKRQAPILWVARSATCAISLFIIYLTLTPNPTPSTSTFAGADKLYHFMAFAILMLPIGAFSQHRWLAALVAAALFGGGIELVQPFFGRTASVVDFLADCTGAVSGFIFARAAAANLGTSDNLLERLRSSRRTP